LLDESIIFYSKNERQTNNKPSKINTFGDFDENIAR
jgi:hypothetical protein